jgi:hypothetical protein
MLLTSNRDQDLFNARRLYLPILSVPSLRSTSKHVTRSGSELVSIREFLEVFDRRSAQFTATTYIEKCKYNSDKPEQTNSFFGLETAILAFEIFRACN